MKPFKRIQRVNKEIKRLLSETIRSDLIDPRVKGIVVTEVVASPDFSVAKVYVRSITGDTSIAVERLNMAKGFLRTKLAVGLKAKKVPKLTFFLDETIDKQEKIETLFEEIHKND